MPENDFYEGAGETVALPALDAGNNEFHQIEIPAGTPQPDLQQALMEDGYREGPMAEGVVENTPAFRDAARRSWQNAEEGILRCEAGFSYYKEPLHQPDQDAVSRDNHLTQHDAKNVVALVHTHPNDRQQDPSPDDIASAKKLGKPVYVISRSGLFVARPSDGQVVKVFDGTDWMSDKSKRGTTSRLNLRAEAAINPRENGSYDPGCKPVKRRAKAEALNPVLVQGQSRISQLAGVRVRVAPLPVVFLLFLGGVVPIVIFLVLLLQVLVPVRVFRGVPFVSLTIVILGNQRCGCKQRRCQNTCG
jgi:proteasome lid subunit RPN8/RPN11